MKPRFTLKQPHMRSDNERLVEEGVEGAEHDQMRRASLNRDG
jgi:hypothetical protein